MFTLNNTEFNMELTKKKKKILAISDIPLAATGVSVQFNQLINYMISTGEYSFYVLGGAIQHPDMNIKTINEDYIIEPCIGQGNKDLVKSKLIELQPDAVFIFTDPHQYVYLWEMADEIHQICPIIYWHVWDNDPYPDCNTIWYDSTDFLGNISMLTHNLVCSKFPEKAKYIPHTFSPQLYYPLPDYAKKRASEFFYQDKSEWYKILWVNRNGHRKMAIDLLEVFKTFIDEMEEREGHKNAVLLLRTEPRDPEGPDLVSNIERLKLGNNVIIIPEKLEYSLMNLLYNGSDLVINNSKAEGFGLSALTAMNTKTLVAGTMTGGMQDQMVHVETGEEIGIPIPIHHRNLIGSQFVPYIFEDYASREDILKAIYKAYNMTPTDRETKVEKAYHYATTMFNYNRIMNIWKTVFDEEIQKYKETKLNKNQWRLEEIILSPEVEARAATVQKQQMQLQQMQLQQQQAEQNKTKVVQDIFEKLKQQQSKGIAV